MGNRGNGCVIYNPESTAMQFVFNRFHRLIVSEYSIRSNLLAVPGKVNSLNRYISFALAVIATRSKKGKALFVDNRIKVVNDIKRELDRRKKTNHELKKIQVLYMDVQSYERWPNSPFKQPARVEDIGLGIGLNSHQNRYLFLSRLAAQSQVTSSYKLQRAQIIDFCRRNTSDADVFKFLSEYYGIIGAQLKSIGGNTRGKLFIKNSEIQHVDGQKIYVCKPKFSRHGRLEYSEIIAYKNRTAMLGVLTIYSGKYPHRKQT